MSLLIEDLIKAHELDGLSIVEKEQVSILLDSINDWPTNVPTLEDYENEIDKMAGDGSNKKILEHCLAQIDYSRDAWKAESLSQLLGIFNYFDEGQSLKEILKEIQQKVIRVITPA
ncbi:MAG TPA: hypothetical protein VHM26_09300 [Chitinophagaceae bacterium]|jgi:hypothetical protein|nr:hypothetical protein [Chitinophagaceae bacterium]